LPASRVRRCRARSVEATPCTCPGKTRWTTCAGHRGLHRTRRTTITCATRASRYYPSSKACGIRAAPSRPQRTHRQATAVARRKALAWP
ncbi:hypothetical protein LPJ66_010937, partial [Kickxella alabastrina]